MVSFAINLNHRQTFLLHINTLLLCQSLDIAQEFTCLIHCAEVLRHSNVTYSVYEY